MKAGTVVCVGAAFLLGCGSAREGSSADTESEYLKDLHRYEAQFRPSDYDVASLGATGEKGQLMEHRGVDTLHTSLPDANEVVSGFRVQLFSTKDIDVANTKKGDVESIFPDQSFYLLYDPPTYKLRAGNFLTRFDAEKCARQLAEKGFPDAWVVPDKVVKTPQARLTPVPPETAPPKK